jgi:cell filamentation protein, protein adenylyltransferase
MDLEAIRRSPIGRLVPISGLDQRAGGQYEHEAFLPEPLPQALELTSATWTAASRAEAALARLDQASQQVPEPALLRRPALRREAQSTSALEGTFAPFEDLLESDVEDRAQLPLEVHEVLNYVVAAEEGFHWVKDRPLTSGLIGQLQRVLVRGTPGEHSDAGGVRDRQVVVGPRDSAVVEARFVPPPPGHELRAGFEQWIDWLGSPPPDLSPVVRASLAHYQFETLHPFSDGNGRIGRLLIVLQLMRDRLLGEPILVVSPWFEARRREYQDGLLDLSRSGDWDAWVGFFSTGVAAAADATRERIDELLAWRDQALATVRDGGVSGVAERLAGELIGAPVLTASRVARDHRVSHQGAMNALRRLAGLGLLREGRRRGRTTFFADPVIELLGR